MEVLSLNLIPTGTTPVVHVKQYDVGRIWRFELKEGPIVYTLDGSETIECDIKKKDGNVVTVAVTNTSASYIDIETTLQMTACSGDNLGAIRIKKGSDDIGTLNFILACERSPLENGIESESSIHDLQTQIGEAVAEQYDAEAVVFDAVPTQGHGTGFAVTSEGVANALDDLSIPDELNDLSDVSISSPTSNQALVWDAENNRWTNGEVSTVGNLDDLSDVDTTGKATGDSLRYDGAEWIAQPTTYQIDKADFDQINDFTPYANSHIVVPDEPNLNPDASEIEYSSGVTVKQAIDSKANTSDTYTKTEVDNKVAKYFDLTASSSVSDSGISPFSFYGQPTKTDSNIHNILSVTVIDTQFNNPAIAVLYGQSGSTFTFMVYSARSGNVKIRVAYN